MKKMTEDELEYKTMLEEQFKIKPTRKAVKYLEERIGQILTKLGVDIDKDEESVKFQMDALGIFINAIGEADMPSAAGLYISSLKNGNLEPYAYIQPAKVRDGKYRFSIYYWQDEILDEGKELNIK